MFLPIKEIALSKIEELESVLTKGLHKSYRGNFSKFFIDWKGDFVHYEKEQDLVIEEMKNIKNFKIIKKEIQKIYKFKIDI